MDERKVDAEYVALDRLLGALGEGVANRVQVATSARSVGRKNRIARSWGKRARGTVGVGLTWAALWGLAGGLQWLIPTAAEYGFDVAFHIGRMYAMVGFVGGVAFSGLLQLTHGRRRFDELRIGRFVVWGALGGFLIGVSYSTLLAVLYGQNLAEAVEGLGTFVVMTTLFGAGSASGSLAIARLADDQHLLSEAGEPEMGLPRDQKRRLLGDHETTD